LTRARVRGKTETLNLEKGVRLPPRAPFPGEGKVKECKTRKFIQEALNYDGNDCLIWPFSFTRKPKVKINKKNVLVCRLICEIKYGKPPTDKYDAAHSCGKGKEGCVNPNHLRWATKEENEADKIIHGTTNRGERHGLSKLTKKEVVEIKKYILQGRTDGFLSKNFGVTRSCINSIRKGKSWRWL